MYNKYLHKKLPNLKIQIADENNVTLNIYKCTYSYYIVTLTCLREAASRRD